MPEEKDPKEQEEQQRQIMQSGSVTTETHGKHVIHCLTIIGQIEGHYILPAQNKTTKYEHILPILARAEQDEKVKGILFLMNMI